MSDQQPLDPRQQLAKMEAEEAAAREKAQQLEEKNKEIRKALLEKVRDEDLKIVRDKCTLHGFTPTDLRNALKTKGVSAKSTTRKSTSKSRSTRKKVA
jgi:multidrug efflux pump subunit AcrB